MKPVTAPNQLQRLQLRGYKSFAEADLELGVLNVLIGPNGAGKSNMLELFRFMHRLWQSQLQVSVAEAGGAHRLLHGGRKSTARMEMAMTFGAGHYRCVLQADDYDRLRFVEESLQWNLPSGHQVARVAPVGGDETSVRVGGGLAVLFGGAPAHMGPPLGLPADEAPGFALYHVCDTSRSAAIKQMHAIGDNEKLRSDGANLAAFLLRLRTAHPEDYAQIADTLRRVAPFFGDFHLRPDPYALDHIRLEWVERDRDEPLPAAALSDGTLRFAVLCTALLQPPKFAPATLLIDEPELGLHPFALRLLAGLIRSASASRQIIVATQSAQFLDAVEAEDVIVVERSDGGPSALHRLDGDELADWLEDYSLGELWRRNVVGGGPLA